MASAYTKNKREARVLLQPELAALLAVHLKHKAPAARAFNVPANTGEMLR